MTIVFNHPILHLVIINAYTKFIKIHKLIPKILSMNKILTSIKGHNSVKNGQKIMCFRHNIDFVYINAYTKVYQNLSICSEYIEENTFLHQSMAITLLIINEFSPFAIPNHPFPITMSMQSLKKIGQKLLKLEFGNEALLDGQMETQNHSEGIKPEDRWSCIAHLIAEDMLKSAVIEEKTFKHSPRAGTDNPLGPKF